MRLHSLAKNNKFLQWAIASDKCVVREAKHMTVRPGPTGKWAGSMAQFELEEIVQQAKIKVIGVGGGGGNAVNTMITNKVEGVEFYTANTDVQALEKSMAQTVIQLGKDVTRGLGAGANPEKGREAALESVDEIAEAAARGRHGVRDRGHGRRHGHGRRADHRPDRA